MNWTIDRKRIYSQFRVNQSVPNREEDAIKKRERSEDKCDDNLNYDSSAGDRVPKESEGELGNLIAFRSV